MGLLKPAVMGTSRVKAGLMGFESSGKTYTASQIAIGLCKLQGVKQAAFFDTEKGSDFVKQFFDEAKVELYVHKARAFTDLLRVMKEAEEANIPLIIDSISHVWGELCDTYKLKYKKKTLTMYDWGILKTQWKEYTDAYVNSDLHILMCGRAGYEYDNQINEDTGKQEIFKTGTKMRAEGQTGFEPDLLLEMERFEDMKTGKIINRCWVMKDRSDRLNGKCIDFPKFNDFLPFINFLNIGGSHNGIDTKRTSEEVFEDPDWSVVERNRRREIALEELDNALTKADMAGTSAEAKKKRVALLEKVFGTAAKTAIENTPLNRLLVCVDEVKIELGQMQKPAEVVDVPFSNKADAVPTERQVVSN